jgi:dimeric dUTPase (all-alpha-NTP-PPase superfamily)
VDPQLLPGHVAGIGRADRQRPWKWWAKYQKFDEQNARVEVVDCLHFLISMAQVLGMSADDVFAAYVKKNEVNLRRQDSGYQAKDADDSRHI